MCTLNNGSPESQDQQYPYVSLPHYNANTTANMTDESFTSATVEPTMEALPASTEPQLSGDSRPERVPADHKYNLVTLFHTNSMWSKDAFKGEIM